MVCVLEQVNIEREGPGLRSLEHQAFCFALEHFLPLKNILVSGAQSTAHSFEELDTFSLFITMLNFCDGVFQLVKQASSLHAHGRWTEVRGHSYWGLCVCLVPFQKPRPCLFPHASLSKLMRISGNLSYWARQQHGTASHVKKEDLACSCLVWICGKTTFRSLNIIDCCPVFSFFFFFCHSAWHAEV